jgi:hypothetical protein
MKVDPNDRRLLIASILVALAVPAVAQVVRPSAGASVALVTEDYEVRTSGPVHEGFASPVVFGDEGEVFVTEVEPPPLIEEIPPYERPSGYAEWIPGYWAWDDDLRGWLWVSGTWRVPPPGYAWISGYWIRTWRGWRYVSGFWAPIGYGTTEIHYHPAPPPTLEAGPIGPPPSLFAIWVPGNWVWIWGGYLGWMWRPGYWVVVSPGWVWVPARWVWTPYGYVYVDGHWDYPVAHSGLLYAPVYFGPTVRAWASFTFTPGFVINVTLFSAGFFSRPAWGHYYFGDYYGEQHWHHGIYPAFSFHYSRHGYDPQFAYASWQFGQHDPHWIEEQRTHFLYLRRHEEARPPRTLAEQRSRPKGLTRLPPGIEAKDGEELAVESKDAGLATRIKVERTSEHDRGKVVETARDMRRARSERVKVETQRGGAGDDDAPKEPKRIKTGNLLPSTVVAGEAAAGAMVAKPPKPPEIPAARGGDPTPDPRIRPGGVGKRAKLRDPSLDLPTEGVVGRRPGGDPPAKKEADDDPKPPKRRPGADKPPKKPDVDEPPKKEEEGPSGPPRRPGGEKPGKKEADDDPKPPLRRPGLDRKKPDDDPRGKKDGDDATKPPPSDTKKRDPDQKPDARRGGRSKLPPPDGEEAESRPSKPPLKRAPEKKPGEKP